MVGRYFPFVVAGFQLLCFTPAASALTNKERRRFLHNITFSSDGRAITLPEFLLDVMEIKGGQELDGPALETFENACNDFLTAEINMFYRFPNVNFIKTTILDQQHLVMIGDISNRKLAKREQKLPMYAPSDYEDEEKGGIRGRGLKSRSNVMGVTLEVEVEIAFEWLPSPGESALEKDLRMMMEDLSYLVTNVTNHGEKQLDDVYSITRRDLPTPSPTRLPTASPEPKPEPTMESTPEPTSEPSPPPTAEITADPEERPDAPTMAPTAGVPTTLPMTTDGTSKPTSSTSESTTDAPSTKHADGSTSNAGSPLPTNENEGDQSGSEPTSGPASEDGNGHSSPSVSPAGDSSPGSGAPTESPTSGDGDSNGSPPILTESPTDPTETTLPVTPDGTLPTAAPSATSNAASPLPTNENEGDQSGSEPTSGPASEDGNGHSTPSVSPAGDSSPGSGAPKESPTSGDGDSNGRPPILTESPTDPTETTLPVTPDGILPTAAPSATSQHDGGDSSTLTPTNTDGMVGGDGVDGTPTTSPTSSDVGVGGGSSGADSPAPTSQETADSSGGGTAPNDVSPSSPISTEITSPSGLPATDPNNNESLMGSPTASPTLTDGLPGDGSFPTKAPSPEPSVDSNGFSSSSSGPATESPSTSVGGEGGGNSMPTQSPNNPSMSNPQMGDNPPSASPQHTETSDGAPGTKSSESEPTASPKDNSRDGQVTGDQESGVGFNPNPVTRNGVATNTSIRHAGIISASVVGAATLIVLAGYLFIHQRRDRERDDPSSIVEIVIPTSPDDDVESSIKSTSTNGPRGSNGVPAEGSLFFGLEESTLDEIQSPRNIHHVKSISSATTVRASGARRGPFSPRTPFSPGALSYATSLFAFSEEGTDTERTPSLRESDVSDNEQEDEMRPLTPGTPSESGNHDSIGPVSSPSAPQDASTVAPATPLSQLPKVLTPPTDAAVYHPIPGTMVVGSSLNRNTTAAAAASALGIHSPESVASSKLSTFDFTSDDDSKNANDSSALPAGSTDKKKTLETDKMSIETSVDQVALLPPSTHADVADDTVQGEAGSPKSPPADTTETTKKDQTTLLTEAGGLPAAAITAVGTLTNIFHSQEKLDSPTADQCSSKATETDNEVSEMMSPLSQKSDGPERGAFPTFDVQDDDSGGFLSRHRRHVNHNGKGDGSMDYQNGAMHPLDWSNQDSDASIEESTISSSGQAMQRGGIRKFVFTTAPDGQLPKGPKSTRRQHGLSPILSPHSNALSTLSGQSSSSNATESQASDSVQLINDLVWLEKKIADVRSSSHLPTSPAGIQHADSLSYASHDAPVSPSDDEGGTRDTSELQQNIVCRDCFAPPGKLQIVIHSTKDGPAVHTVKEGSVLEGRIFPGDLIISVDNVDTRTYSAEQVMRMMSNNADSERKITVLHFEDL